MRTANLSPSTRFYDAARIEGVLGLAIARHSLSNSPCASFSALAFSSAAI
jgi:hypothetical protein